MQNYLIKFSVNGVFNEKCVSSIDDKEARRKVECQYGGQRVRIISCMVEGR